MKPKLKIAIVLYNNPQSELELLFRSLEIACKEAASVGDISLCFVNNGDRISLPKIEVPFELIEGQGNVGFGAAHNIVFKQAFEKEGFDFVLSCNPDGALHQKCLSRLLEFAGQHPGDLISARQFPEEHPKAYEAITGESEWLSGACLMHNKSLYEKIGGFDDNFFMYMEDVDLSWRARVCGVKTRVCSGALFSHSVLNREFSAATDKMIFVSGRYLAKKWKSSKMLKFCEKELLSRKHFETSKSLPAFPATIPRSFVKAGVGNFSTHFSFGDARW